MSIKDFEGKYSFEGRKIEKISKKWESEKVIKDLLNASIAPNLVFADILLGQGLIDRELPPEILSAMNLINKNNLQTPKEIQDFFLEKVLSGSESEVGLINQLQGAIGELKFESLSNGRIQLAHVSNQEAVDAVRIEGEAREYIQIKVYSDADKVIEKMHEVNEKVSSGQINWENPDGSLDNLKDAPTFAVNEEIYEEVKLKAARLGLENKVENLGISREEIREGLSGEFDAIESEFFESLFGAAALATGIQSFFQWYVHRDLNLVLSSLPRSLTINTAGTIGAVTGRTIAAEALLLAELEILLGFASPVVGITFAIFARGIASRLSDRSLTVKNLEEGNQKLLELMKFVS